MNDREWGVLNLNNWIVCAYEDGHFSLLVSGLLSFYIRSVKGVKGQLPQANWPRPRRPQKTSGVTTGSRTPGLTIIDFDYFRLLGSLVIFELRRGLLFIVLPLPLAATTIKSTKSYQKELVSALASIRCLWCWSPNPLRASWTAPTEHTFCYSKDFLEDTILSL